jgi:ABC-type phosphate/phosphonate transport system substrate-binding protein
MNMKYGILFTVLVVSVLLAGCVEQPKETQSGVEEIKMGVVAPLTGGASTNRSGYVAGCGIGCR